MTTKELQNETIDNLSRLIDNRRRSWYQEHVGASYDVDRAAQIMEDSERQYKKLTEIRNSLEDLFMEF